MVLYPVLSAGGGGGGFSQVVKTATETIQSDDTLNDDSELTFSIGSNKTFLVIVMIIIESGAVPDFKFSWGIPSGSTFKTYNTFVAENIFFDFGINMINGASPTEGLVNGIAIARTGATAGNITFQWSQNTSDASNTSVKKGSVILFMEIDTG